MERQKRRQLKRNELLAVTIDKEPHHTIGQSLLVCLFAVIFVVGAYALRLYGQTKSALESTYQSAGAIQSATVFKNKKPFSILLLGADTGALGRTYQGNSDTMIVVTVNPQTEKVVLTSVPRDTMAQIIGTKEFTVQKINAAYMHGGSEMAMDTVNSLLNMMIDYYLTINMGGLQKVVDALGGVDVDVPFDFSYAGSTFKKGQQHLNGTEALSYARMRYDDPNNDYGRQMRQRQIITSVIKSAMSTGTLANFKEVLNSVSKNMKTNLTFNDMITIFQNYRSAGRTVKSDYIHGVNATIDHSSYQIASTEELQRVSDNLRTEVGLSKETLDNEETRQNELNATKNGFVFNDPSHNQVFNVYEQDSDDQVISY